MDMEKVNNLLEKKEFFDKICEMKSAEEVQKAFKENGLELSIEDIKELERINHKVIEEMNSHELENIAGSGIKGYHFEEGIFDALAPYAQKKIKKFLINLSLKIKPKKYLEQQEKFLLGLFVFLLCH